MKNKTIAVNTIFLLLTISIVCLIIIQPLNETNNSEPVVPTHISVQGNNNMDPSGPISINICSSSPCSGGWM